MTKKQIRWGVEVPPLTFAISKNRPPKLFLESDGYVIDTTIIRPRHFSLVHAMKKKGRRKRVGRKEKNRR
jgi:hypothetical protein